MSDGVQNVLYIKARHMYICFFFACIWREGVEGVLFIRHRPLLPFDLTVAIEDEAFV